MQYKMIDNSDDLHNLAIHYRYYVITFVKGQTMYPYEVMNSSKYKSGWIASQSCRHVKIQTSYEQGTGFKHSLTTDVHNLANGTR
jgi:hypothetical protein